MSESLIYRKLGLMEYQLSYQAMSSFTNARENGRADEIWALQHPPVYTLGLAGKKEHVLDAGDIPVVSTDRGGQVTYHGPGQLVMYLLLDLRRRKIGVKDYVHLLEQSVIDYLAQSDVTATRKTGAPGVYVEGRKIAALGIRVRRACSYHGLALNVNINTRPFQGINPCGYPGLEIVQMTDFGLTPEIDEVADDMLKHLLRNLFNESCNVIVKSSLNDLSTDVAAA